MLYVGSRVANQQRFIAVFVALLSKCTINNNTINKIILLCTGPTFQSSDQIEGRKSKCHQ